MPFLASGAPRYRTLSLMNARPTRCPNKNCRFHQDAEPRFYTKMGYYRTKHNRRRVPRYRCRACGKSLSTRTESPAAGQHKPQVNEMLMKLVCSGVTMRRSAKILGVARDTVLRKVGWCLLNSNVSSSSN